MVVRSLESFEVPALLGLQNGTYVFTSRIYFVLRDYPPDLSAAGALAIGLLVIAIIGVVISNFAGRASKNYQTVTGKGFRPRPMELGKWRPVAGVLIIGYFLLTVIAPLLVLLYTSLLKFYAPPSKDTFKSMTLDNYRALAHTCGCAHRAEELAHPRPVLGHAGDGLHGGRRLDRRAIADIRAERSWTGWRFCRWSCPGW